MIKGDFAKTELCKSCPYYSCNPVSPKKIENADLMVIGEAPQGWKKSRCRVPPANMPGE
jgi:uracil-DNA glycosylase